MKKRFGYFAPVAIDGLSFKGDD